MSAPDRTPFGTEALREHIRRELLRDDSVEIDDEQDLLLSGLLDSLNAMRLVSFVEERAGITVPPEDVVIEHFGSLSRIVSYVASRGR